MSNSFFRFREFVVCQDKCAMKVCTDASLFGAWLAGKVSDCRKMLDIGTGTGLLSLMVAQKSTGTIDAVEIDGDAASQAEANFGGSPWADRLQVVNKPIQEYWIGSPGGSYDLIFSNPPFFGNDLKSPDSRKSLALHGAGLNFEDLTECVRHLLAPGGLFSVLIPYHRSEEFERLALQKGLYMADKINVRQTPQHTYFRTMYLFCNKPPKVFAASEVVIKGDDHKYTREFSGLMEDYYLLPDNALR
jgi:tRNA1Val (adenine37-N6)-methyltransferase